MDPINFILIGILVLIVGFAIAYIIRAKKNGAKCIGCSQSKKCSGGCSCGCGGDSSNHIQETNTNKKCDQ